MRWASTGKPTIPPGNFTGDPTVSPGNLPPSTGKPTVSPANQLKSWFASGVRISNRFENQWKIHADDWKPLHSPGTSLKKTLNNISGTTRPGEAIMKHQCKSLKTNENPWKFVNVWMKIIQNHWESVAVNAFECIHGQEGGRTNNQWMPKETYTSQMKINENQRKSWNEHWE